MNRIKELVVKDLRQPQPRAHNEPCPSCPSAHHPDDPETKDILTWPREEQVKTAFSCGWNNRRYCKGYCDKLNITEQDLINLNKEREHEFISR